MLIPKQTFWKIQINALASCNNRFLLGAFFNWPTPLNRMWYKVMIKRENPVMHNIDHSYCISKRISCSYLLHAGRHVGFFHFLGTRLFLNYGHVCIAVFLWSNSHFHRQSFVPRFGRRSMHSEILAHNIALNLRGVKSWNFRSEPSHKALSQKQNFNNLQKGMPTGRY